METRAREARPDERIGAHVTYFEEPDIIFMRLVGDVARAEGAEMNRRHRTFADGREHVFFLLDLAKLESIDPEVRKIATETLRDVPLRGIAIYEAPIKARVIAKLIITALNLFRRDERTPVQFTGSEPEARAWIAARRAQLVRAAGAA